MDTSSKLTWAYVKDGWGDADESADLLALIWIYLSACTHAASCCSWQLFILLGDNLAVHLNGELSLNLKSLPPPRRLITLHPRAKHLFRHCSFLINVQLNTTSRNNGGMTSDTPQMFCPAASSCGWKNTTIKVAAPLFDTLTPRAHIHPHTQISLQPVCSTVKASFINPEGPPPVYCAHYLLRHSG